MAWHDGLEGIAYNIAETDASRLRVMAGPGTGKSFAMKRRVARLLEEGLSPDAVPAVTFTRNAARALIDDLNSLGIEGSGDIHCGTLHSFCFRLLVREDVFDYLDRKPRPLIYFLNKGVAQFEAAPMLKDIAQFGEFGASRDCTKRIRAFEAAWARLQSEDPGWPQNATDRAFHGHLIDWLRFHNAMLIGELVPESLRFVRNNPASPVLNAYEHVIVDEYQDLNKAEQELLDYLAENGDLAIVGDSDQSIYSFRHAHPDGIDDFAQTHDGTHDETLNECRRCPLRVVAMADHLIRQNHPPEGDPRLDSMPGNPEGDVHILQWSSIAGEIHGLATYIEHLIDNEGYDPGDILVLSPRRLIGYAIRDVLRDKNVPQHSFYHEEPLEARDAQSAFALLNLVVNPEDRVALRWWLGAESPSWNVGEYARLREFCVANDLSPKAALDNLITGGVSIPRTTRIQTRYRELLERLVAFDGLATEMLVDELFPDQEDWALPLREASLAALDEDPDAAKLLDSLKTGITQPETPEDDQFVRIMSLHKSKGLTSRAVVVAGCIEGLIPVVDSSLPLLERQAALEEQRRLFFVAMTRCREILVLSSTAWIDRGIAFQINASVRGAGNPARTIASRFIGELGPTAPDTVLGQGWIDGL